MAPWVLQRTLGLGKLIQDRGPIGCHNSTPRRRCVTLLVPPLSRDWPGFWPISRRGAPFGFLQPEFAAWVPATPTSQRRGHSHLGRFLEPAFGCPTNKSQLGGGREEATVDLRAPGSPRRPPGPGSAVSKKRPRRVRVSSLGRVTTGLPGEKESGPQNLACCCLLKNVNEVYVCDAPQIAFTVKFSWGLKL